MMRVFLLSSLVIATCTFSEAAEQLYDGKPESYWINCLTNKNAGETLARLGDNQVRVLLKAFVQQDGPDAGTIRTNAATLLRQPKHFKALLLFAESDDDSEVKESAIGVFVEWLEDPDASNRAFAASSLLEWPEAFAAAYKRLTRAAKNTDPFIRKAAAEALRTRLNREGVEGILQIFYEESWHTFGTAADRRWDVTVKVVDEAGVPIESAEVWIPWRNKREWESTNASDASAKWADFGRSERDGLCKFLQLSYVGDVTIQARKSGYLVGEHTCSPPHTQELGGPPAGDRVLPMVTLVLKRAQNPIVQKDNAPTVP